MTTHISLNNQAFWTPPMPYSPKPRYEPSSDQSQNQEATLPALGLDTSPSHDTVVISSDGESDAEDTNDAENVEVDTADYLPSIQEIMAKQGAEHGRTDTSVSFASIPEIQHLIDAESPSSSVISQRSESAPIHNRPGVSSSVPISPLATIRSESRQLSHSEEVNFCQPIYSSVQKYTPQPESETTPDVARGTALNTALGTDLCENDSAQPTAVAPADMAISTSEDAAISRAEDFDQASPADAGGGVAVPEPIRRLRTRPPKTQPAKRCYQASTTHSLETISDEEVPTRKRRRMAVPGKPAQKPLARASGQNASRRSASAKADADALPLDEDHATDQADASFQEWSLPDAVLQRIQVNGRATLQLQFTWATPCASHEAPATMSTALSPGMPNTRRGRRASTSNSGIESADSSNTDEENDVHLVARLLARWKRGIYLLEWVDGTTSWEPKRNILDRQMINAFEATYRGFNAGINVSASRIRRGRQQWRVHWHGRPAAEDCWVDGKLMDPALVEKLQSSGLNDLRK